MKLFQIEEPDGSPVDPNASGVAIGIDLGGKAAEVAVAVGGNAALLADRDGFMLDLTVPAPSAPLGEWQLLFEGARLRAERMLGRPVTHVVLTLPTVPDPAFAALLMTACEQAGLAVLQLTSVNPALAGSERPALRAAIIAEELAPRPPAS